MQDLTYRDKKLINILSKGIPLTSNPYKGLAGLTEKEVLNKINRYKTEGLIRRLGATLNHTKIGFGSNAMSIWNVPKDKIDSIGNLMASYSEITHCYERRTYAHWSYNIYAMIHGKTKKDCERVAGKISKDTGVSDYKLLYSTREFKKVSMEYF